MPSTSFPYRAAAALAVPVIPLLMHDPRQRMAHRARLASTASLIAWGNTRDPARQLAWFHAASVGEGLQAEAVIRVFRATHPDTLIIYTYYSPSALPLAARLSVDWVGYLPYDRVTDIVPVLEAVRPDLLVFTKVDLWPELACQAASRGITVAMIAATVEPGSRRLRWPAHVLARPGYESLAIAGAISRGDAERLALLGCAPERIVITGDPRIDSVLDRIEAAPASMDWTQADPTKCLIAGSTWPVDESMLTTAFEIVWRVCPEASLVLVPHDPSPRRLAEVEQTARAVKIPQPVRLSTLTDVAPLPPFLIVDKVGVLAEWYVRGALAYVGGGFGTRGIHSVLEPAAAGRAVVIGPQDRGSRDAQLLESSGGLVRLPQQDAASALAHLWLNWLNAPDEMFSAGAAARGAFLAERGAAKRSVEMLDGTLKAESRRQKA